MQAVAENPEAAQKVASAGAAGVDAARRADPSGQGSLQSGAKVMAGAAAAGGIAVTAAAGSVTLGLVGAAGAAYAASRSDAVGDAARSTGKAAIAVGNKAAEFNREHHITDKVSAAAKKGYATAKEVDQKHNFSGKAASGISKMMNGLTKKLEGGPSAATAPPPPPPEGHVGVFPKQ